MHLAQAVLTGVEAGIVSILFGPMADDPTELVLNRTWRPQLAITGIEGLPQPGDAGNVLLPYTTAKLSLRLPPTLDPMETGEVARDEVEPFPRNWQWLVRLDSVDDAMHL